MSSLKSPVAAEEQAAAMGGEGEGERCPVEEVALVVPETDDPSMPVMTFRAWTLGLTSCVVLIFLNTFFTYRTQPLTISGILAQILVLPVGRFMASVLPDREVRLLGGRLGSFNLNPGPFNVKEHVIITIFANCGVSYGGGDAYSIGAITVMKAYYKQTLSFVCALLIVLTTQILGYGWAGMLRRYLVDPAEMWWPSTATAAFSPPPVRPNPEATRRRAPMTEDRTPRASDEPTTATKQRKKRKWDQPAEDLVSAAAAAAAVAGLPVMNIGALSGVPLPGTTAYPAAPLPNIVPVPYALPPQLAPSVLQSAAAAVQKLSQAKIPDELIAREIIINDADPSVRYKLTKRQTQEEIQRSTGTVIITRGKHHPPNGQPDGEKPLYLHISAGSQLKDTSERIKAVDRAASMIEEILKQGQIPEATSVPFPPIQSNGQAVHPFSASIFLGFDADPSLNIAARIRGPNDQYINHIMNETRVTVVLRGKDSGNLGDCHAEASQQPLHLYLSSVHLKSLEAAKVLAENLLDTIAAEFGASRISSSKVYGAVPPPQQLAGVHTSGTISDVHSTLGPNVSAGALHSFASTGVTAPIVAPSVTLQSGAPTYSGVPLPSNLICRSQPANGGTFYSGYGDIYPQTTPLQQVALTLKHASSTTTQVVSATSTPTSTITKVNSSAHMEADKRSQKRKFQELPVSKVPTAELQNSQQESKFVKTGLNDLGKMSGSSIAPPMKVKPGSNVMLPQDTQHMPSHLSICNNMPPPPPKNMPPPPPKSMPPPPPKFPSNEMLSSNENMCSDLKEPMAPPRSLDPSSVSPPKFWSAQLPSKEPREEKPSGASVSDTLLKLMDYGDDDDDDIDETDSVPRGNPTPSSGQKPFWAV